MTTRKILVATPTAPIAIDVNSSAAVSVTLSGARGANGYGVPVGGDTGAVLAKSASGDYLTSWLTTTAFGRGLLAIADAAGLRSAAGLANVDNTADASKPVSTAQALAISAAVAAEATIRSSGDSSEAGTRAAADTALDGRLDVLEADPITATAVASGLSGKAALSHTHAIADTTGLQTAIDAKAPLASPALTGTPTSPTAVDGTSTTQIASTAFVQSAVGAEATIRSGADTALDGRLDTLEADPITATAVASGLAGKLAIASNLGDLNNAATARTNLGLGSLATQSGTFSGTSSGINTGDQTIALTGDVTGSGSGSFTATVAANAITNAKAAQMAAGTIKGNNTGATASASDLTAAQVRGVMALPTSTVTGRLARYTDTAGAQGATAGLFEDASGNVGIGTTSPASIFQVNKDAASVATNYAAAQLRISGATSANKSLVAAYDTTLNAGIIGAINFGSSVSPLLLNPAGGNVGIGTTSPFGKLHVYTGASTAPGANSLADEFVIEGSGNVGLSILTPDSTGVANLYFGHNNDNDAGRIVYNNSDDSFDFFNSGAQTVKITGTGNVGIGTSNPGERLEVSGAIRLGQSSSLGAAQITHHTNNYLYVRGGTGGVVLSDDSGINTARVADGAAGYFSVETGNGTERMRINASGNVGIGTAAPRVKLDVYGPVAVGSYTVATVPSAVLGAGQIVYVVNEAGGACLASSDGTYWRRTSDRAVVVAANGSQSLLALEYNGLALDFTDQSARIKHTATPANEYDSAGQVSAGALVGPGGKLTYTAPSLKLTRQSDGVYRYQAHNLYLNSAAPANQSVTVVSGATYSITITGTVSVTASGAATGTWTAGTNTFAAATTTLTLGSTSGAGTVHLRRTPSADTYIATTSAAKYDLPYEWDAAGSALGILVEEARTNLLLYSRPQSAWATKIGFTLSENNATGVIGDAATATLITRSAGSAYLSSSTVTKAAAAATYTASYIVRKNVGNYFISTIQGSGGANRSSARVDLSTGTIIGVTDIGGFTGGAVSISTIGGGWYRVLHTATSDTYTYIFGYSSVSSTSIASVDTTDSGYPGTVASMYLQHAQLEAGSFATSPIETFGSTVTRAADNISLATSAFPYNQSEWTLVVRARSPYQLAITNSAIALHDGGTNRVLLLSCPPGSVVTPAVVTAGGVSQLGFASPVWAGVNTVAITGELNNVALSVNGSAPDIDTSVTMPSAAAALAIGASHGQVSYHYIERALVLPRRVTNAELQGISAP